MSESTNTIKCPNCGEAIDVSSALSEQLRREHEASFAAEKRRMVARENALKEQEETFESKLDEQVKAKLKDEKPHLRKELEEEMSGELKIMQEELREKSEKVKEYNQLRAVNLKLERSLDGIKDEFEAKAEARISEEVRKAKNTEKAANELKQKDLEKKIEDLRSDLSNAQKRAEQGSMQLQGEVQELAIEEWLSKEFPLDSIEEIKKGALGGDCIQHVNTRERTGCGMIYYESKRTRSFQPAWIPKLKDDMRAKGADIAVLVTEARPSGVERISQMDGIWICSFSEFKALAQVFRQTVIRLDTAIETSRNRGEKMGMLYDYLTGPEFRLQAEAIAEGVSQMREDLESEKRSMRRIWKKREKQIERVVMSTSDMYGAIQGIAGTKVLPTFEALALPAGEDHDEVV